MKTRRELCALKIGYSMAVYERIIRARAGRTWPVLNEMGCIDGIAHIVMHRKEGLDRLIEAGESEHSFERIILNFPDIYPDPDLQAKARAGMDRANASRI